MTGTHDLKVAIVGLASRKKPAIVIEVDYVNIYVEWKYHNYGKP